MSDFWKTPATIEAEGGGKGYPLFAWQHLMWLGICVICTVLGAILYKRLAEKGRKIFCIVIAILLILNIVIDQIILLSTNQWTLFNLPLHACNFGSYIVVAHAFWKKENKALAGLCYGLNLPCAVLALMTPACSVLPLWNFASILSYTFHIMLIMYPVNLMTAGYVPRFKDIKRTIIPMLVVAAVIYGLNKAMNTDFLYINGGTSVGWIAAFANLFGPVRDLYVIVLFPLIMVVLWTALYLPIYLVEKYRKKKAESKDNMD